MTVSTIEKTMAQPKSEEDVLVPRIDGSTVFNVSH